MKKYYKLLMLIVVFCVLNVKADMGPPVVADHEIIVTNKDGAYCYSNNGSKFTKTSKLVPFGTVYKIYMESEGNYISVSSEDGCDYLKSSDVKSKTDSFSVSSQGVTKINNVKAVILANGGLNMRKGPAISYSKIMTIPQYSVVTLKYNVGTYWYYAEYNGHSGWISGKNQYFGYNDDGILYSYQDVNIIDKNNKVIGKIPALTEVTDYLKLVWYDSPNFYVNYNGIKGYVIDMPYKSDGEIKLLKDAKLYGVKGNVIDNIKNATVLKYSISMIGDTPDTDDIFYIPSKNGILKLNNYITTGSYSLVGEEVKLKKTKGFIGEGLFGEKVDSSIAKDKTGYEEIIEENNDTNDVIDDNNQNINNNDNNTNVELEKNKALNKEVIIICILGSIVLALTVTIIIILINSKKQKKRININEKSEVLAKEEKKEVESNAKDEGENIQNENQENK